MGLLKKIFLTSPEVESTNYWWRWDLLAIIFLATAFTFFESICPYYFSQDDNLAQFFPVIIDFCRHLDQGNFSTYNPYLMMGFSPISFGYYALTYPGVHFSYFFSKYVLSNPLAIIEVFAILHITFGYFALNRLMRLLKIGPDFSFLGGICFVLSGYAVVMGRAWYYMLPQLVWCPLIYFGLVKLTNKATPLWIVLTGLCIGISFHAGNAQMWIYCLMFYCLVLSISFFTKNINTKSLVAQICSLMIGFAIALPLLFLTHDLTKNNPSNVWGITITDGSFLNMILPYSLYLQLSDQVSNWFGVAGYAQATMYSGTLFTLIGLSSIPLFLTVFFAFPKKMINEFFYLNKWLLCGIIALFFGMGDNAILWPAMKSIPPFNKFSNPFKFIHFVNLFFCIGSGIVLQRFFYQRKKLKEKFMTFAISLILLFIIIHLYTAINTRWNYNYKIFPPLPDMVKNNPVTNGRIFSISPDRSSAPNYYKSLSHNLPSYYEIPALHGYDNLAVSHHISSTNFSKELLHKSFYGYSFHFSTPVFYTRTPSITEYEKFLNKKSYYDYGIEYILIFSSINNQGDVKILKNSHYIPLASLRNNHDTFFKIKYTPTGMNIFLDKLESGRNEILVNFLYYPQMKATLDGEEVSISEDEKSRMVVLLNRPGKVLRLSYELPWKLPIILSCLILAFTFMIIFFLKQPSFPWQRKQGSI